MFKKNNNKCTAGPPTVVVTMGSLGPSEKEPLSHQSSDSSAAGRDFRRNNKASPGDAGLTETQENEMFGVKDGDEEEKGHLNPSKDSRTAMREGGSSDDGTYECRR
ncbi:hypothetical protein AAY473_024431 [Plecturocebus cupreus]